MCGGASPQQQELSAEQQQFYQTMTNAYNTTFGQSQAITGALTSAFTPILAAGPSQTGFSPSETQALTTQADTNTATNYAQAQQATADILAAQGGGNTLLPSGVNATLEANNTNAAALARTNAQNTITQNNYAQGYQNWQQAANVLGSTAGLLSPTSYASTANTSGQQAETTANQINNENTALWKSAIGAIGGIAGNAVGSGSIGSLFSDATAPFAQPDWNAVGEGVSKFS
jgi:hypothetical protein